MKSLISSYMSLLHWKIQQISQSLIIGCTNIPHCPTQTANNRDQNQSAGHIALDMSLIQSVSVPLKVFYFLGQSPYVGNARQRHYSRNHRHPILSTLPSYIFFGIYIGLAGQSLFSLLTKGKPNGFGMADTIITSLSVGSDCLKAMCVFSQCFCHQQLMLDMMNVYHDVEIIFSKQLQYHVSYDRFRRRFRIKASVLASIYFASILPQFYHQFFSNIDSIFLKTKLLNGMMVIAVVHSIFYFDLQNLYAEQLQVVMRRDTMELSREDVSTLMKLKCYKLIHFRLWENCQRLNAYFGWALVVLFMRVFVHTVVNIYWQVAHLKKSTRIFPMIRMQIVLNTLLYVCSVTKSMNE